MNFIRSNVVRLSPLFFIAIVMGGIFLFIHTARAVCTTPVDNLSITADTTLCTGTYTLTDADPGGVIRITASNVTLDCEANTIIRSGGNGSAGVGIAVSGDATGYTNVTIKNCRIENYGQDILAGNASNLTIQNNTLVFTGPVGQEGKGLQMSANDRTVDTLLVTGNTFSGTGNGMSFSPGNTATNVTIENNTFSASIDDIVLNANNNTSTRFTLSGNTYTSGTGEIIGLHNSTNTVIQNETMQSGTTSNVLIKDSPGVTVRGNNLARANFQLEGATNGTFDRNFVGGVFNVTTTSTGNTFTNNIVGTNQNWSFRLSDSANNTIRNNTFHGGVNYALIVDGASTNSTFKNNIVSGYAEVAPAIFVASGSATGFASDYNIFYGTNGAFTSSWSGITQSTFAAWRTASSQDAHSSLIDPLYTNSSGNDFTLRVTSPAIDAGDPATTTPTADYLQSTRPYGSTGRWDVGAYETSTPVTTSVSLAGTPTYSDVTGNIVSLMITDTSSNPTGTKYAIYESSTAQWLQGNGTGGASPVYNTSTTWTHTNLSANTAYSYDVRTANSGETTITSLKGSPVSVTTTPAAPTNIQLTSPSSSGFTASWTAPAGTITSYDLSYGITNTASDTVITGITTASRALTGLSSATQYFVKVRANTASGAGAYSSAVSTSTLPSAPTSLQASNITTSGMTISWTAPSGSVSSYDLSYGPTAPADTTVITGITTATRSVTSLSSGTTYFFKVRAVGAGGNGAYTSTISATTSEEPADEDEPESPEENEPEPPTEEDPEEDIPASPKPLLLIPDSGVRSNVRVVNHLGEQIASFFAYGILNPQMDVVMANVTGDASPEIITFPKSPNATTHVRIFTQTGRWLGHFWAFEKNLHGGLSLAVVDMDNDGRKEMAVIPYDQQSRLRLYDLSTLSKPRLIDEKKIYDSAVDSGSDLLGGDVTGDGNDDLVIINRLRTPNVQLYTLENNKLAQKGFVFPYPHPLDSGVNAVLADVDGDAAKDIVLVPNGEGSANIQVYRYYPHLGGSEKNVRRNFRRLTWRIAYTKHTQGGFSLASGDINNDGRDDIVVAGKKGKGGHVQSFTYDRDRNALTLIESFFPYGKEYHGGVYVTLGDIDGDSHAELITSTENGNTPNTRIYSYVGQRKVGWILDTWFYAFDASAKFGNRTVVGE